jgi:hypothetical protein
VTIPVIKAIKEKKIYALNDFICEFVSNKNIVNNTTGVLLTNQSL